DREMAAGEADMTASSSEAWAEMAPLLDEAIARLPETDRNAVLLRYFEGKRLSDVGLELGISVEAAKKRVARAVERLRQHLTHRGVILLGLSLIALLSA